MLIFSFRPHIFTGSNPVNLSIYAILKNHYIKPSRATHDLAGRPVLEPLSSLQGKVNLITFSV